MAMDSTDVRAELEEVEIAEVFGNMAHRFSMYRKRGVLGGRRV
jgi:hypothetical protein